jgi:ankyrin repeat protein
MSAAAATALRDRFVAHPLHVAVIDNDIEAIKCALSTGIDINSHQGTNRVALSLAIELKHAHAAQWLLSAGATIDALSSQLESFALGVLAATSADTALLAACIAAGLDLTCADSLENTFCHFAATNANEAVLAMLLAVGAPCNERNSTGKRACHLAAANENDAVIALLIDAGVDCLANDVWNQTACHVAAANRNERVLARLLAAGVPHDARDAHACTPCHAAASNVNEAVLALLIAATVDVNARSVYGSTPLSRAAHNRNEQVSAMLIAAGAVPSLEVEQYTGGRTLVHVAALNPNVQVLKQIIALDVDVNARDDFGAVPLFISARLFTAAHVEALLAGGAALGALDNVGRNVGHYAAMNASSNVLEFVLSRGIDVDARDESCRTACHVAGEHSHVHNLRTLLDAGTDIDAIDTQGQSVVHVAAKSSFAANEGATLDTMRCLLQRGANFRVEDAKSRLPIHRASGAGAAMLFAWGANIEARDGEQQTPCAVATTRVGNALLTLIAAGANTSVPAGGWRNVRADKLELLAACDALDPAVAATVSSSSIASACKDIAERQWMLMRLRAFEVCTGLQALDLPALLMCEILAHVFAPRESMVPFHRLWAIATKSKHRRLRDQ